MPRTQTDTDLRLHVRFEPSPYDPDKYAHVTVMPVILARGKYGRQEFTAWDVDSYELDDVPANIRALKGLRVHAQSASADPQHFYGYRLSFDAGTHGIELADAERILPVLRRLERKMTALSDRFGYPRDLAGYLAHLADALGLSGQPFVRRVSDTQDYEGHGHRSMNADSLRYWLADETEAWRERYGITVQGSD